MFAPIFLPLAVAGCWQMMIFSNISYRCWRQTLCRSECDRANFSSRTVTSSTDALTLVRRHSSMFAPILLPLPKCDRKTDRKFHSKMSHSKITVSAKAFAQSALPEWSSPLSAATFRWTAAVRCEWTWPNRPSTLASTWPYSRRRRTPRGWAAGAPTRATARWLCTRCSVACQPSLAFVAPTDPSAKEIIEISDIFRLQFRAQAHYRQFRAIFAHFSGAISNGCTYDRLGQILDALAEHAGRMPDQAPQLLLARLFVQALQQGAHGNDATFF